MNTKVIATGIVFFGTLVAAASAQEGATTGMIGGAATGAIIGGPVGAGVGAVAGAVAGAALEPPPERVVTYVQQQPVQQSVVMQQPIVVGKQLPRDVVLMPVAEDPRY